MVAFILGGLLAFLTLIAALVVFWANAMSDAPGQSHPEQALYVLVPGLILAAVVVWSHWWTVGW